MREKGGERGRNRQLIGRQQESKKRGKKKSPEVKGR